MEKGVFHGIFFFEENNFPRFTEEPNTPQINERLSTHHRSNLQNKPLYSKSGIQSNCNAITNLRMFLNNL